MSDSCKDEPLIVPRTSSSGLVSTNNFIILFYLRDFLSCDFSPCFLRPQTESRRMYTLLSPVRLTVHPFFFRRLFKLCLYSFWSFRIEVFPFPKVFSSGDVFPLIWQHWRPFLQERPGASSRSRVFLPSFSWIPSRHLHDGVGPSTFVLPLRALWLVSCGPLSDPDSRGPVSSRPVVPDPASGPTPLCSPTLTAHGSVLLV